MNIVSWIKQNILVVVLMIVIGVLIAGKNNPNINFKNSITTDMAMPYSMGSSVGAPANFYREAAPTETAQRMVVQDTNMSMLVKDVQEVLREIENVASQTGGYMVNRSLSKPEGAASGNITLRVPTEKREVVLNDIRALGVKVVSENVYGNDVTDQYVDIETRLANLQKVKAKMENIQDQAQQVQDLMQTQAQINNIQQQIDNLKGQQNYLSQTAKLSRITVNLSTDELALPYAPDDAWRPAVVFKTAVRAMIGSLRGVANAIIWAVVYLPVVLIAFGVLLLGKYVYATYLARFVK